MKELFDRVYYVAARCRSSDRTWLPSARLFGQRRQGETADSDGVELFAAGAP